MIKALCVGLVLVCTLRAQPSFMQAGNYLHGFGGDQVALLDTAVQTTTPLRLTPTGVGAAAFIWDPAAPDDVVTWGTDSRLYRSTVTSPNPSIAQLGTTLFGGTAGIVQLSWDQSGDLTVIGNQIAGQIFRVDRSSGATTTLLGAPLPGAVLCGEVDPSSGDFYLGVGNDIYRVSGTSAGAPSVTPIYTGQSQIRSLTMDRLQTQFLVFVEGGNLHRINKQTLIVEDLYVGVPSLDLVRPDVGGSFIAVDSRNIYAFANPLTIPPGGVPITLLGTNATVGCCNLQDFATVGATNQPYNLTILTQAPGAALLSVLNPPPATAQSWLFVSATTLLPAGSGPLFGLLPDALTLSLWSAFATPVPGSPIHSLGPPPPATLLPSGTMTPFAGQTWDLVSTAFSPVWVYLGRTNIARVTWQ